MYTGSRTSAFQTQHPHQSAAMGQVVDAKVPGRDSTRPAAVWTYDGRRPERWSPIRSQHPWHQCRRSRHTPNRRRDFRRDERTGQWNQQRRSFRPSIGVWGLAIIKPGVFLQSGLLFRASHHKKGFDVKRSRTRKLLSLIQLLLMDLLCTIFYTHCEKMGCPLIYWLTGETDWSRLALRFPDVFEHFMLGIMWVIVHSAGSITEPLGFNA